MKQRRLPLAEMRQQCAERRRAAEQHVLSEAERTEAARVRALNLEQERRDYALLDDDSASEEAVPEAVVVYTANFGRYDAPLPPRDIRCLEALRNDGVTFVRFTDDLSAVQDKTGVFRTVLLTNEFGGDAQKMARKVKLLPHLFLPLADIDVSRVRYSLWMDAYVLPKARTRATLCAPFGGARLSVPAHPVRECAYDEEREVLRQRKDTPLRTAPMMRIALEAGYPPHAGLSETVVLWRRHGDAAVQRAMEQWYAYVAAYSGRDQLSFDFVLWQSAGELRRHVAFAHRGEFDAHFACYRGAHRTLFGGTRRVFGVGRSPAPFALTACTLHGNDDGEPLIDLTEAARALIEYSGGTYLFVSRLAPLLDQLLRPDMGLLLLQLNTAATLRLHVGWRAGMATGDEHGAVYEIVRRRANEPLDSGTLTLYAASDIIVHANTHEPKQCLALHDVHTLPPPMDDALKRASEAAETTTNAVTHAAERAGEALHDAKDAVAETLHDAKDAVAETLHDAKDAVAETLHDAKDAVAETLHDAKDAVAAAETAVGEAVDHARDAVGAAVAEAREAVSETVHDVKDAAVAAEGTAVEAIDAAKVSLGAAVDTAHETVAAAETALEHVLEKTGAALSGATKTVTEAATAAAEKVVSAAEAAADHILGNDDGANKQ